MAIICTTWNQKKLPEFQNDFWNFQRHQECSPHIGNFPLQAPDHCMHKTTCYCNHQIRFLFPYPHVFYLLLSFINICFTSTMFRVSMYLRKKVMTYSGCIIQMYFFTVFSELGDILLSLMSCDWFVTIDYFVPIRVHVSFQIMVFSRYMLQK